MPEELKVMFRKETSENGVSNILAVYPDEEINGFLGCYSVIGQHSECHMDYVKQDTTKATKKEYEPFIKHLMNLEGYENIKLKVVTRAL